MAVAEALGKFEHEVLQLSPDEFARWIAYFKLKKDMKPGGGNRTKMPLGGAKGRKTIRSL